MGYTVGHTQITSVHSGSKLYTAFGGWRRIHLLEEIPSDLGLEG